ncbi:MAG TPA: type II CAAX endopeptidase family protein [Halanaerobiales bacterium]|nr:type II CAAX endopeptidase family protein [Halanaerobiales bacterium]
MEKLIKKYQVLSFISFTYLFSWGLWTYLLITQEVNSITQWLIIIGGFGPLFGALMTNYFSGGKEKIINWFKTIINKNFNLKSIIFAVIYPLVVAFLVYMLINTFDFNHLIRKIDTRWYLYPLNLLTIMFFGGGQEEFGWRGFVLPNLLDKFNPFTASLIVGGIWFIWHLPLIFIEGTAQAQLPIIWYLINIIALSIIFTFLRFIVNNRNIVPAVILHGGVNISQNYFNIHAAKAYYLFTFINIIIALILIIKDQQFWFKKEFNK